ncbi:MAG: hypothetical protein OXU25_07265 [Thaumarchaeota archaeon]|nr:hypothetical protein [Nitrososphaerota archaeon]
MERHSPANRWIVLEAIRRLSAGCPCAMQPWSPARPPTAHAGHCPFRAGSAMEVRPNGHVGYALSPPGSADYGAGYYEKLGAGRRATPMPPLGRISPEFPAAAGPEERRVVPPQAGFRTLHAGYGRPTRLEFAVPSGEPGGTSRGHALLDFSRERPPGPHMGRLEANLDACGYLASEMELTIWPQEDALCFGALDTLGEGPEFCYDSQSTLDTLAKFVWSMNAKRPRALHFDTVFMDHGMYLHLFGQDGRTNQGIRGALAYENLVRLWGITFLCPEGMPFTESFVTSSRQGPIFANGPHTTACDGGGISVEHHCAMIMPPGQGDLEIPWGARIGTKSR